MAMDNRERVRQMADAGVISETQAERLLASLESTPSAPAAPARRRPGWLVAVVALLVVGGAWLLGGGGTDPGTAQDVASTLNQPGSIATMNRNVTNLAGLLLVLVIPFLILAFTYNGLVNREEAVFSAWSDVESTYQRRADLIPRLVESVSRYLEHESAAVETVAGSRQPALRTAVDELLARQAESSATLAALSGGPTSDEAVLAEMSARDSALRAALGGFRAIAEDYPDLRSSDQFLELQAQLEGTENRINVARLRFNNAAEEFNAAIRRLPGSLVAGFGNFQRKAYFKAEAGSDAAKPLGL
jgi:LemA protein